MIRSYLTKILLILCLSACAFYSVSFYSIDLLWDQLEKKLIINNSIEISKENVVHFSKKEYIISPSKIGVKIYGIKHIYPESEVLFSEPLVITFNPWTFDFKVEYEGAGKINSHMKQKNKKYTNLLNFEAAFHYEITTNLDFVIIKKILSNPYKMVNYIQTIDVQFEKLKISMAKEKTESNSSESKSILEVKNSYYSIKPEKFPEYISLSDIFKNPPKFYSIEGFIEVVNDNSSISIPNTIFSAVPNKMSFKGNFLLEIDDFKNQKNLNNMFYNSKIRFICNKCETSFVDFFTNINLDLLSNPKKSIMDMSFKPKKTFTKEVSNALLDSKMVKYFLSFLSSSNAKELIKNKMPKVDLSTTYFVKFNSNFNIVDQKVDASINEFTAFTDKGSGIGFNGSVGISDSLDYNLDINVLMPKARAVVNYWNDYYFSVFENILNQDPDIVSFNNELNLAYIKEISDYPNSPSEDMLFKISYNGNNLAISGNNYEVLKEKYFKAKTFCLLKILKKQKDPIAYLNKVAPEINEFANDLLKIDLNEPQKISDDLWQKLIK